MCHNCFIDMYDILVKHLYRYHEYHMIHAHLDKILSKMQKCANISNTCQFGTMSYHQTDIHLMNMSLTFSQIRGIHLSCHITSPTISAKHSYTKHCKNCKCRHTYDYYYGFDIALSAMYTILQKE